MLSEEKCSNLMHEIADPARAGMSLKLIQFLLASGARTIVYVSCNPATQARDIARLCTGHEASYRLKQVQACDMFPNTAHIECVAVLERCRLTYVSGKSYDCTANATQFIHAKQMQS